MLVDLRGRFDLSQFEYTRRIRIAPTEIPHSHPTLTLNTWVQDDLGLLSTYLHEQMHWYVTWYSHVHSPQWSKLLEVLRARYPAVPVGTAEGAPDAFSCYLHLIVNWLEIDAAARFLERDRVIAHVGALAFYRWMYRTVIEDWEPLATLYRERGLIPVRYATDMSSDDLRTAALYEEAPA